jgi:hypothetical protein
MRHIASSQTSDEAKMVNKPELMAEQAAADYIGMSVAFLRFGRCHGVLGNRTPAPPYLKLGRAVRYARADLDTWLAARRVDRAARQEPA